MVVADFDRAALAPKVRAIVDYYVAFVLLLDRQKLYALKRRALENKECPEE